MTAIKQGYEDYVRHQADAVVNREREALAQAASAIGHPVTMAVWDPRFRGIDEAILGGATIRFRTWPEVSGAPVR